MVSRPVRLWPLGRKSRLRLGILFLVVVLLAPAVGRGPGQPQAAESPSASSGAIEPVAASMLGSQTQPSARSVTPFSSVPSVEPGRGLGHDTGGGQPSSAASGIASSSTFTFVGWYVDSIKVLAAQNRRTVTAKLQIANEPSGHYNMRIRRDIAPADDETVEELGFDYGGGTVTHELPFVPLYETGMSNTNGYYVDLQKDGTTLWTLDDAYPPRLPVIHGIYIIYRPGLQTHEEYYPSGQIMLRYTYYLVDNQPVFHGLWTEWYETGRMMKQGQYQDGLAVGMWTDWYGNGQKWAEWELQGGRWHGAYTKWWENGQLWFAGEYKDGKMHGLWTYWTEEGQKTRELQYEQDTLVRERAWYSDGSSLQYEYRSIEGTRYRTETEWWPNGQMESQYNYKGEVLHGAYIEWDEFGRLRIQGQYLDGKKHGLWTSWRYGQLSWQAPYLNDKLHGTYTKYFLLTSGELSGEPQIRQTYAYGIEHGPYAQWGATFDDLRGLYLRWLYIEGQYSNSKESGIWKYYPQPWRPWDPIRTYDLGPGEPLEIPVEQPYEPVTPTAKEIRGHITDANTGGPIDGATVTAGVFQTSSDSNGFYRLVLGDQDTYAFTVSKDGFYAYSDILSMAGYQYKTLNVKLEKNLTNRPAITNVKSKYGRVFLQGIPVRNEYVVAVDWQGEPGTVTFDVNGTASQVAGTTAGASRTFDMGSDFRGSSSPLGNSLKITAVNKANVASDTVTLHPVILPIPEWAQALGSFAISASMVYSLEGQWPAEPIEILLDERALGPIAWKAWGLVPFIGGQDFGLRETQAFLKIEVKTTGEGSVAFGGKQGITVAATEVEGKIAGRGRVNYEPDKGLVLKGASVLLGGEANVNKEVAVVTLIPALGQAVSLPLVGRVIAKFNEAAKVVGNIKVEAELDIPIVSDGTLLGASEGEFELWLGAGLALESTKLKVRVTGGGGALLEYQLPPGPSQLYHGPSYVKDFKAQLWAKLVLTAWLYQREFEAKHNWPTEPTTTRVLAMANADFHPVPRDFLNHTPYNNFVASVMKGTRPLSTALSTGGGASEKEIMANVYPYSEPAIAENQGKVGIAFVYFDPDDPTIQATEIYLVYYDGQSYVDVGLVQDDTRAEFNPAIAFDRNGNIVAVWERVKNESLTSEDILEMARAMEIVYAVYAPATNSWSQPQPLSDNDYLDHSPILRRDTDGKLLLVWQSNQGNELIGAADSPSRIHYAIWDGEKFGNIGTLPQEFANSFKFSLAYQAGKAVLSYAMDRDGDLATAGDEEIFYTSFDGSTWSSSVRVSDDQEADVNPQVVYKSDGTPEMVWLKGETLVRLTDWNAGEYEIVRERSQSAAFTDFRIARDPQDRLVLLWQDIDERGTDLFYSVYDPDNKVWNNDLRLTEGEELETDFEGVFSSDGILHLIYNRQNLATQANDLYYLLHELSADLAVSSQDLSTQPEKPSPGTRVALVARVENKGDTSVKDVSVAFYLGDPQLSGTLIGTAPAEPMVIKARETGQAILPWTIPENLDAYTVYAVADPENTLPEINETNNSAHFDAVRPDLEAIDLRLEERGDGSVDVIAVIANGGARLAAAVEIQYQAGGEALGIIKAFNILPGITVEVAHTVWPGIDVTRPEIEVQVDPQDRIEEEREDNNRATALLSIVPRVSVSPTSHGFGDIKVGSSSVRTFTISNTGNADLDVATLSLKGTDVSEFSIQNDNLSGKTIGPSESGTVDVIFAPISEGAKEAALTISSSDPSTPLLDIPLQGMAVVLRGDVNDDDSVDIFDLVAVAAAFNSSPPANPQADVNGDGIVNIYDLALVGANFGQHL